MISNVSAIFVVLCVAVVGCDKGPSAAGGQARAAKVAPGAESGGEAAEPAAAKNGKQAEGKVYGEGVSDGDTVEIAAILKDPEAYENKEVRVEGMVTDVCPKRGCWFEMAGKEPGQKLRFKVKDGVMVFPMDAKGKKAVAQGVVKIRRLTLDETKQYMEYQAEEYGKEYDPAKVTEPTMIVRIDGKGAVIRN